MIFKKNFSSMAVSLLFVSISCNGAPSINRWIDSQGENKVSIEVSNNTQGKNILLNVFYYLNDEKKLKIEDFIAECELDSVLEINSKSIQVLELQDKNNKAFLFSYRIGCVGGVDPLPIKYFAFYKNNKYVLRGEETISCNGEKYGGEMPPKPDSKLKEEKELLFYMSKKWKEISKRKCNN